MTDRLRTLIGNAWRINPPLTVLGLLTMMQIAISVGGLVIDPQIITGVPAWLKPLKFAVSITLYSFTLLWLLSWVRGHQRIVRIVSYGTLLMLGGEMVIIIGQVLRGTTSHFNFATPLDGALFSAMGMMIVIVWLLGLVTAVLLLVQRIPDSAVAWSLRLGIIIALAGMGAGFLMTSPTAAQLTQAETGSPMRVIGAHSVGVADGGPGLPLTGWSTEGDDLRVGHFVGMHALQVIPIVGILAIRLGISPRRRLVLVLVSAAGYAGLFGILIWQALRGQPLLAPNGLTFTAVAALAIVVVAGLSAVLTHRRPMAPVTA